MGKYQKEDTPERARRALKTLHEARETADDAVDNYIDVFYQTEQGDERRANAQIALHKSVIRFYSRLRPYLVDSGSHDKAFLEKGGKSFRFSTLSKWRVPSKTTVETKPRLGEADALTERESRLLLPPDVAFSAYDALNEAFVDMEFGAEVATDVETAAIEQRISDGDEDEGDGDGDDEADAPEAKP
jgi:hypothetical protein